MYYMARAAKTIFRLKVAVAVLSVAVAALALYIAYPSVELAVSGQPYGSRLTGINSPLSSYQLSVINNAPNSYFENAGEMLLNLSIKGEQSINRTYGGPLFEESLSHPVQHAPLVVDSKPSVIYIGAISCIYCGENRWAMALALSRFGKFGSLYTGYSSIGDGDVPTLYWVPQNYTSTGSVRYGNDYNSSYINFFSAEYDSPISGGFQFPASSNPIKIFVANATNQSYYSAMSLMNGTGLFQGTPYTFWGTSFNLGASGVVFGNGTSSTAISNKPPLTYMSHSQIFNMLHNFNSTFAYEEYAVAGVYVAQVCSSINNTASACSLPAIRRFEAEMGI